MKKIQMLMVMSLVLMLFGCVPKEYNIKNAEKSSTTVAEDRYMLAGATLRTIEKSDYENDEVDVVYYVESEEELLKVLQYNIEQGKMNVSYQGKEDVDIDKVGQWLSYLNAFDLSVTMTTTDYTDGNDAILYRSNEIKMEKLDKRYDEALRAAKRIKTKIIHEGMDRDAKIAAIHDYLAKTTVYNEVVAYGSKANREVFQAEGALLDKDAVCAGYSRAFMMVAKLADVPAIYVVSDTINHGWNMVYGNNGWRFIDVTWDDPIPDIPGSAKQDFLYVDIDAFTKDGIHLFDQDKPSTYYLELVNEMFLKE